MTQRPLSLITAVSLVGLAVFLGVLQSLFGTAPPARALAGTGHGPGYLSADGWWLGAYRFDDGAQGFCLNPGKVAPVGLQYSYADPEGMGWWTPEQSAVFAYIARTWAGSGDRLTAAAGQLATWIAAGMSEPEAQKHAARAGADTDAVYARAHQMLAEAQSRGSTGVRAAAVVELAASGPGRVRVELTVDRLSGAESLAPGASPVSVTLDGAAFDDGGTTATIPSGTDVPIVPSGTAASVSVTATATTPELPYGHGVTVALPAVDAQAVLIARSSTASAVARADAAGPSPLPFQPRVETRTTAPEAHPGAEVADRLIVSVDEGDGLLPTWGVRATADGFEPVTAVVESTLHGPFPEPIAESESAPADGPTVCTVETVVDGAGEYTTPPCAVPSEGYYVWTERIDPSRTPESEGGARVKPWTSRFGVAEEISRVAAVPVTPSVAEPTTKVLAATGSDVSVPVLWSAGSALAGVGLVTRARLRDRRHPRRARSTWMRR
ncbi:hypothetical protein [Leifsonia sp. NPDC077715]|uniref:hypothetical protein n=1 Tax=Leifsonia sp. NPDC077715 TaxID=3155539 RepID=UPI0034338BC3